MQPKNLLKKNSVTLVESRREVVKAVVLPRGRLGRRWCRHEAECLLHLAELGFAGAPKLISLAGNSFTMEKIEGESLNGAQCVDVRIFLRVMDIVRQLHGFGYAHGNLRPSNILITAGDEPILIDFETCCRRRNPLFHLAKFSDQVKLYLLWQSRVARSDHGLMTTPFPRHVTLAMFVITPASRFAGALKATKKSIRKRWRNTDAPSAEQRESSPGSKREGRGPQAVQSTCSASGAEHTGS